ncbi:MAG: hypothetical protein JRI25_09525, partial [Deltaproteobacteria bacterium]|nr:hypothetical protein [Deltaproteobacteria bacterium]
MRYLSWVLVCAFVLLGCPAGPTSDSDDPEVHDSDGDTVPDSEDICDGYDDRQDGDSDGVPDGCDPCPLDYDDDSDEDGSCDSDDLCPGFDDADDLDLDQVPDGCDPDRDGDTILDEHEGQCLVDTDQDLVVDCEDLDSDEDGIPDAIEAGDADPLTEPVDTDGDLAPDFVDLDADDDGLLDEDEAGCPGSTERTLSDSDADTYSDLVEVAIGSDACSIASDPYDIVDAYVVLDGDAVASTTFEVTAEVDRVDVLFSIDTTGSMDAELGKMQDYLADSVVRDIRGFVSDAAFGVSAFRDFPLHPFGGTGDYPFRLVQRVTTDETDIQSAVDSLTAGGAGDGPESGFEALYQIAVGDGGVTWSGGGGIGAFDPTENLIPG